MTCVHLSGLSWFCYQLGHFLNIYFFLSLWEQYLTLTRQTWIWSAVGRIFAAFFCFKFWKKNCYAAQKEILNGFKVKKEELSSAVIYLILKCRVFCSISFSLKFSSYCQEIRKKQIATFRYLGTSEQQQYVLMAHSPICKTQCILIRKETLRNFAQQIYRFR